MLQRRWSATHWVQVKESRTFDGRMASFSWKKCEQGAKCLTYLDMNSVHLSTSKWIHRSIGDHRSILESWMILSYLIINRVTTFEPCFQARRLWEVQNRLHKTRVCTARLCYKGKIPLSHDDTSSTSLISFTNVHVECWKTLESLPTKSCLCQQHATVQHATFMTFLKLFEWSSAASCASRASSPASFLQRRFLRGLLWIRAETWERRNRQLSAVSCSSSCSSSCSIVVQHVENNIQTLIVMLRSYG